MARHFNRMAFFAVALSYVFQPLVSDAQAVAQEPKSAIEWFARSRDAMNIRFPGSKPFHLEVSFHAFPGDEFLPPEKCEIITGDGTYEEFWMDPHHWRREVKLADYHAVEVESDQGRKFQQSSDYEPGRVLMLLNALLNPVPRNFASREFLREGASGWTVDHLEKGDARIVRISKSLSQMSAMSDIYYFLPHGLMFSRNEQGLETSWSNDIVFAGKVVPTRISIKSALRELVAADIRLKALDSADSPSFELPGALAEPGMTLRPILPFEAKIDYKTSLYITKNAISGALSMSGVIDKSGRYREVEFLATAAPDKDFFSPEYLQDFRDRRFYPPEMDGSPCEVLSLRKLIVIQHFTLHRW